MLSRIKWESIDELRPTDGSLKHIPKAELAALKRAKLQRTNNALAFLSWRGPNPLTKKQEAARNHKIVVSLPKYPFEQPEKIVPSRNVSAFEALPFELMFKIIGNLDIGSRFCLALTSKTMTRITITAANTGTEEHQNGEGEYRLEDHDALMKQLRHWMPSHLQYCYHCLIYVPRSCFGPRHQDLDQIACMDCRFYSHNGLEQRYFMSRVKWDDCDGCESIDRKVDGLSGDCPYTELERTWALVQGGECLEEVAGIDHK